MWHGDSIILETLKALLKWIFRQLLQCSCMNMVWWTLPFVVVWVRSIILYNYKILLLLTYKDFSSQLFIALLPRTMFINVFILGNMKICYQTHNNLFQITMDLRDLQENHLRRRLWNGQMRPSRAKINLKNQILFVVLLVNKSIAGCYIGDCVFLLLLFQKIICFFKI